MSNPTEATYTSLVATYEHFNRELFDHQLPPCLITMQRHGGSSSYFSARRFTSIDSRDELTDEIALNPTYFAERKPIEILSTLVHEMCHLWQHHFGKPTRKSYHNKEWAAKMGQVGLIPTATGAKGGKQTSQKMSHIISKRGRCARAASKLQARYPAILYLDRHHEAHAKIRYLKAASKTKYTCPSCGLNAWAKTKIALLYGTCQRPLEVQSEK